MMVHNRNELSLTNLFHRELIVFTLFCLHCLTCHKLALAVFIGSGRKSKKSADQSTVLVLRAQSKTELIGFKKKADGVRMFSQAFKPIFSLSVTKYMVSEGKKFKYSCFNIRFGTAPSTPRFSGKA